MAFKTSVQFPIQGTFLPSPHCSSCLGDGLLGLDAFLARKIQRSNPQTAHQKGLVFGWELQAQLLKQRPGSSTHLREDRKEGIRAPAWLSWPLARTKPRTYCNFDQGHYAQTVFPVSIVCLYHDPSGSWFCFIRLQFHPQLLWSQTTASRVKRKEKRRKLRVGGDFPEAFGDVTLKSPKYQPTYL